jgi:hypothetical protein
VFKDFKPMPCIFPHLIFAHQHDIGGGSKNPEQFFAVLNDFDCVAQGPAIISFDFFNRFISLLSFFRQKKTRFLAGSHYLGLTYLIASVNLPPV